MGWISFPIMELMRSEPTATVPTATSLELPNMAYTNGGTKLESALFLSTYMKNVKKKDTNVCSSTHIIRERGERWLN